jgi:hypothetical protein
MAKPDMSMEPKITFSKIFIFQPIFEFQKHYHYTEANAVKLSAFQSLCLLLPEIFFWKHLGLL